MAASSPILPCTPTTGSPRCPLLPIPSCEAAAAISQRCLCGVQSADVLLHDAYSLLCLHTQTFTVAPALQHYQHHRLSNLDLMSSVHFTSPCHRKATFCLDATLVSLDVLESLSLKLPGPWQVCGGRHHAASLNSEYLAMCISARCVCCRTRFYRAELRGTAAWEHDLEHGMQQSEATIAAGTSPGLVPFSPSLGPHNSLASGLFKPEVSGMNKAWGSANLVMAPDGTPIMPSSTTVRPKAKVSAPLLYPQPECQCVNAQSVIR